jgi:uncharacterized repeat protein (TIGR04052 family)
MDLSIEFGARIGSDSFRCGDSYLYQGLNNSEITPRDLRFFIHDVEMLDALSNPTKVTLNNDGVWQTNNIALLDFEDAVEPCDLNGTPETNTVITGQVPTGNYTGLRFKIGVPFEKNHSPLEDVPPPLTTESLFIDQFNGHAFFIYDFETLGQPNGWGLRVSSNGCNQDAMGNITGCVSPNVLQVSINTNAQPPSIGIDSPFDPERETIVLNLKDLLATSDVDANSFGTPTGCTSIPTDPECPVIMSVYGFGALGPGQFISVE